MKFASETKVVKICNHRETVPCVSERLIAKVLCNQNSGSIFRKQDCGRY